MRQENLEKCLSIGVAILWLLRTLPPACEDAQASALGSREAHSPQVSLSHVNVASQPIGAWPKGPRGTTSRPPGSWEIIFIVFSHYVSGVICHRAKIY